MNIQSFPFYNRILKDHLTLTNCAHSKKGDLGSFEIPQEIIKLIFNHLNELQLIKAAKVSHTFNILAVNSLKIRFNELKSSYYEFLEGYCSNFSITTYISYSGAKTKRAPSEEEKKIFLKRVHEAALLHPNHLLNPDAVFPPQVENSMDLSFKKLINLGERKDNISKNFDQINTKPKNNLIALNFLKLDFEMTKEIILPKLLDLSITNAEISQFKDLELKNSEKK